MSDPIARIVSEIRLTEETPSLRVRAVADVFRARARRLARRGGIAIHPVLHLLRLEDMDKTKTLTSVTLPSRSQDRDPHGDHREPPGEDPGGYYGQRALRTSSGRMARLGPCSAVGAVALVPRTCDKVGQPKLTKLTLYVFTPVIGSDNGGFTRPAAQSRKYVDGYFRRFGHQTECHDATRFRFGRPV